MLMRRMNLSCRFPRRSSLSFLFKVSNYSASQRERIAMLKTVLIEKGLNPSSAHYGILESRSVSNDHQSQEAASLSGTVEHVEQGDNEDGGIYL